MSESRTARAVPAAAAALAAGVTLALAPTLSVAAHAAGTPAQATAGRQAVVPASKRNGWITRKHVIARAKVWYKRNVQYSQSGTAWGAFGKTPYRRDCSGFVSMAWHLAPVGMSAPNTVRLATKKYTHRIKKKNLRRGDILDWPGHHVVLFQRWANKKHTRIWLYEEANPTQDMNHYTAPLSKYRGFQARRYNHITKLLGSFHG